MSYQRTVKGARQMSEGWIGHIHSKSLFCLYKKKLFDVRNYKLCGIGLSVLVVIEIQVRLVDYFWELNER